MFSRITAVLIAGLFMAGCSEQPSQESANTAPAEEAAPSADETALEQVRADYASAYNAHDAAALAALFADSAILLSANGQVSNGKAEIQANLEQELANSPSASIETGAKMVFGDHAVARGTYTVTTTLPEDSSVSFAGNYMTLFHKIDGQWKISALITDFNAPPPEGMPMAEGPSEPPADNGTMADLVDAWTKAFDAGDWAALASLYTTDADVAYSNGPELEGPAALQARMQERFGEVKPTIEIHDVATMNLDDQHAVDGGWYTFHVTTPDGPIVQSGSYVNLLQKQADGSWKIQWAVSNGQPKPAT